MEINEHIISLKGKANIPKELEMGRSLTITMEGSVDNISESDNQDGTVDKIYRFRPLTAEIVSDNGEIMKSKPMTKWNQKLAQVIWHEWKELNESITERDYYDKRMADIVFKISAGEI